MKGIYLILIILLLPFSVAGQILITTVDENLQPLAEVEVVYQTVAGEQKGKTDSLGWPTTWTTSKNTLFFRPPCRW